MYQPKKNSNSVFTVPRTSDSPNKIWGIPDISPVKPSQDSKRKPKPKPKPPSKSSYDNNPEPWSRGNNTVKSSRDSYPRPSDHPNSLFSYEPPNANKPPEYQSVSRVNTSHESKDNKSVVVFCQKMLDHVHTENYKNFFQGLLADLTDDNFLGETSLQPVPGEQQDYCVIIDGDIIPQETQFIEVIAPNGNYVTCKLMLKGGFGFLVLKTEPLIYGVLYAELELERIATLKVKFLKNSENK